MPHEPPVQPKPAATLIVLRDGTDGLEVLMTERPQAANFAGGAMVFPGGKLDETDHALVGRCVNPGNLPAGQLAFGIAAIRECFEECGLLYASGTPTGDLLDPPPSLSFAAVMASGDIWLRTDLLVPFAHWITPTDRPRRFDTRFFAAAAPPGQAVRTDAREVVRALWSPPRRIVDESLSSGRLLVPATYLNLWRLSESLSVAEALDQARATPMVPVMPQWHETGTGQEISIPDGAGYSVTRLALGVIRKS